jgi:4-amino-4-deoxy-L-arabinose transferase-like glycosyltransferase
MAPAIAALFGIGIVTMWQDYQRSGWRGWLLPLALIATALEQIHLLSSYPAWGQWMIPVIAVLCILGAVVLSILRLISRIGFNRGQVRILLPALSIAILSLMIAPTVWAGIPVMQNVQAQLPVAGPSPQGDFGGNRGIGSNRGASVNTTLVSYLEANQGKATYLVATPSSHTADEIILTTNKPVMALGGFSGGDPILTSSQLASLVKNGTVRFFLLNSTGSGQQAPPQVFDRIPEQFRDRPGGGGGGGFGGGQQSSLTSWVTQHCTIVPASQWQSSAATTNNTPGSFGAGQLYDCATTH